MTAGELLLLHFQEIRRRSHRIWTAIPPEFNAWQPDKDAMTSQEMVRHVLESEHLYQVILLKDGDARDYVSPWTDKPYVSIEEEIDFAAPFREGFLHVVQRFDDTELETREIFRPDVQQRSSLGKYLLKVAYHEAVHAGQLLSYLRMLGLDRPAIWY
jgi:uncharacterized damage-inducible protein DinB